MTRTPSIYHSYKSLLEIGIPFETIIDVGVNKHTPPLIKMFPDKKHILIEPLKYFNEFIQQNYQNIDYEILNYAVGNENATKVFVTHVVTS